jgi:hypothetical protein
VHAFELVAVAAVFGATWCWGARARGAAACVTVLYGDPDAGHRLLRAHELQGVPSALPVAVTAPAFLLTLAAGS